MRRNRLSLSNQPGRSGWSISAVLVTHGLTATFVRVAGRGSRAPLVDAPGQAQAVNRRVEVLVR